MKKTFLKLWVFSLIFIFASCGENLSFKEGAAQGVVNRFLKSIQDNQKEMAQKFVLDRFKKDAAVNKFINSKLESVDQLSDEFPSLDRTVSISLDRQKEEFKNLETQLNELKEKLKNIEKPEKEDVDKMQEIADSMKKINIEMEKAEKLKANPELIVGILKAKLQEGLDRLAKETYFTAKLTVDGKDDTYIIFYFASQNINHITGIYPVDVNKSSVIYYAGVESLQKELYKLLIENVK